MKIKAFDSICIFSENPDRLAEFYEKTLGLKVHSRLNIPGDKGMMFLLDKVFLYIGFHSEISGQAKEPKRIMPGFTVDSVDRVYEEITPKGVDFIQKPTWSPDHTFRVATALDPDGNILQFFSDYKT